MLSVSESPGKQIRLQRSREWWVGWRWRDVVWYAVRSTGGDDRKRTVSQCCTTCHRDDQRSSYCPNFIAYWPILKIHGNAFYEICTITIIKSPLYRVAIHYTLWNVVRKIAGNYSVKCVASFRCIKMQFNQIETVLVNAIRMTIHCSKCTYIKPIAPVVIHKAPTVLNLPV